MSEGAEILSRDELRELMREVLVEHHELVGLPVGSADERTALKQDALFLRNLRKGIDSVAAKVGYAVIMGGVTLVGLLLAAGWGAKVGGH